MPGQWAGSTRKFSLPPDWPAIRSRILRRDGHRCVICGAPARQVDHITPAYLGGTDDDDNLASLCDPHHAAKSSREGHDAMRAARARIQRQAPRHPGLV
jgi:5-methylcytosine-specific restriction protein A